MERGQERALKGTTVEAWEGEFEVFLKEMLSRFLGHTQESLPQRLSLFGAGNVTENKVNGKGTQPPGTQLCLGSSAPAR